MSVNNPPPTRFLYERPTGTVFTERPNVRSRAFLWPCVFFPVFAVCLFCTDPVFSSEQSLFPAADPAPAHAEPLITLLKPEERGGKAYRLTYQVAVPLDVYWLFKTDFDNDFLTTNKYIHSHAFIKKKGHTVVTENTYAGNPERVFRWRTQLFPERHRLAFELMNPQTSGQQFHYGYIQLTTMGRHTQVTQVAYFDFWGVSFWVKYPWRGGMEDFLKNTARWEQQTVLNRQHFYSGRSQQK